MSFKNSTKNTSSNPAVLSTAKTYSIRNITHNDHKKTQLHLLGHSCCDYCYVADHCRNEMNLHCAFQPISEPFYHSDHTYSACQLTDSNSHLRNSEVHDNNKQSKASQPNSKKSTAQRKRFNLGKYLYYCPN